MKKNRILFSNINFCHVVLDDTSYHDKVFRIFADKFVLQYHDTECMLG